MPVSYCERCERFFGSEDALGQHKRDSSHHYLCYGCEKDCTTQWALTQHFVQSRRHHYCQRCNEHFDDEDDLESHYEDAHYFCPICRKVLDSAEGLRQHNRQHGYCPPCKRIFRSDNELRMHLETSAAHNERKHACPRRECDGRYICFADLLLHLECGACPSGICRYDIDKLAIILDRSRVITSYSVPPSPLMQADDDTARFCPMCDRIFPSPLVLRTHLNSGAHAYSIYQCPETRYDGCGREFTTLSALMQHVERGSCGVRQNKMTKFVRTLMTRVKRIRPYRSSRL